jgi:hypothetical protein
MHMQYVSRKCGTRHTRRIGRPSAATATAPNGRFAESGAIQVDGGNLTIIGSSITDNAAELDSALPTTGWDQIGDWLARSWVEQGERGPEVLANASSVLWTPTVAVTPRQLDQQVPMLCRRFSAVVEHHRDPHGGRPPQFAAGMWNVELLIVDEADRLKPAGLEQLRHYFDRHPDRPDPHRHARP